MLLVQFHCVLGQVSLRDTRGRKREWEDVRPGYYGLEGVGDVAVAYADPGYDAEETHETDDTRTVGRTC